MQKTFFVLSCQGKIFGLHKYWYKDLSNADTAACIAFPKCSGACSHKKVQGASRQQPSVAVASIPPVCTSEAPATYLAQSHHTAQ